MLPINYEPKKRPRSQDKIPLFIENGAFYAFGSSNYKITNCRIHGSVGEYPMEELRSIDIDDKSDFMIVEHIFKKNLNKWNIKRYLIAL